jgi:hypothetical protein
MERYENAMERYSAKVRNMDFKGMKASQIIRNSCRAVFECFNDIFGEGTDRKVFGDTVNLTVAANALEELQNNVKRADKAAAEKFRQMSNQNKQKNIKGKYRNNKQHRR